MPNQLSLPQDVLPLLVGDVGGTNARFALYCEPQAPFVAEEQLSAHDFPKFSDALKSYIQATGVTPKAACLAVAAPILGDRVSLTNRDWQFSKIELREQLGLNQLVVINDFEALARALPYLTPGDYTALESDRLIIDPLAPKLVMGPGTGLGVAYLIRSGSCWVPLPGEGGHVSFAPRDNLERRLQAQLSRCGEHLSYEDLLSGPGLEQLYQGLLALGEAQGERLTSPQIISSALNGDPGPCLCLETFCAILGSYAGDLAMIGGARGGVYLGGGILPRIIPFIRQSSFRERFEDKGKLRHYVEGIPTLLITARLPALVGAASKMALTP